MFNKAYPPCDEASTKCNLEMPRATVHTLCFPESFSRTSPLHDPDPSSDASLDTTPPNEKEPYMFPMLDTMGITDDRSPSPPHHCSKKSVMKLENILNDVSIGWGPYIRSRSLVESPTRSDLPFEAIAFPTVNTTRVYSTSPVVKKKKVKMHKCPECQKEFPRPSGLKTHMNMHTKEKPFACTYPGCKRSFSVVSNAKRHMRTHGVGVRIEDHSSESPNSVPYVVGFETPVIVSPAEIDLKEPLKLRWVATPSSIMGSPRSGTSSTGSSRERSLSGVRGADLTDDVKRPRVVDDAWATESVYDFRSPSSELDSYSDVESPLSGSRDFSTGSSSSSPRSNYDFQSFDDNKLFFGLRGVENERSPRTTSTGVHSFEATVNRSRPEV